VGASRRASAALGGAVLAVAFFLRIANLGPAFQDGRPILVPLDDLYQAKRIIHSARHFPSVLDFDPDRGVSGAFCPWPPLYPLAAGGLAALLGGRTATEILARAAWFPPVFSSLVAGLLAGALARRLGLLAGAVGGAVVALSVPLVANSRVGAIDHHFLESGLLLALLAATLRIASGRPRPAPIVDGLLLALALVAALFVQPALLLGAALSFLAIFFLCGDDASLLAGASGFGVAAAALALHQLGKPAGSPSDVWFLGIPHLAALLAAATACALRLGLRRRFGVLPAAALALLGALGVALWLPDIPWAWLSGSSFFGGDPWLATIEEFQPLFRAGKGSLQADLLSLGGAALLVIPFVVRALVRPTRVRLTVALFAATYLLACVPSRRFLVPAIPLFAIAAAGFVAGEVAAGRRLTAATCAAIVAVPALFGLPALLSPPSPIPSFALPAVRAARWLKARKDGGGRVLGPWSWGHLFDVVGERSVLLDNFGAMLGRTAFEAAVAAPLLPGEERFAEFCRRSGVRYVVLDNPLRRLSPTVSAAGFSPALYLRPGETPASPARFTRLAQASFWWRAYFDRGEARPEAGRWGRPFRHFRLVWADAEQSGEPAPYDGPALQIWELDPDPVSGGVSGPPQTSQRMAATISPMRRRETELRGEGRAIAARSPGAPAPRAAESLDRRLRRSILRGCEEVARPGPRSPRRCRGARRGAVSPASGRLSLCAGSPDGVLRGDEYGRALRHPSVRLHHEARDPVAGHRRRGPPIHRPLRSACRHRGFSG
jgi:asparagine N-glycosylation enzyme membrane subunit Stt3